MSTDIILELPLTITDRDWSADRITHADEQRRSGSKVMSKDRSVKMVIEGAQWQHKGLSERLAVLAGVGLKLWTAGRDAMWPNLRTPDCSGLATPELS
ncbi:hypothetical protein [Bradyrhizobium sp. USDA 4473]